MLKVRRAAELVVTAEELRASTLSAERPPTDLAMLALVRLEGIADRAVRRLGLDRKPEPAETTLAQYLETRQPVAEQVEGADSTETSGPTTTGDEQDTAPPPIGDEPAQHEEGGST
jgi:hypothetical protein